jgi:hypothetical protein
MKSSIKIQFSDEKALILVTESYDQDDPRDQLIRSFREKLGYISNWATVRFFPSQQNGDFQHWVIEPVKPEDLQEQIDRMKQTLDSYQKPPEIK